MNPNWRSFLETTGGKFDGASDELADFGDAAGELNAAATQTVVVPLTHLDMIEASGEEAKAFLHGQFTSDVNHLDEAHAQHSGWCSAKGRLLASFLLWRDGESYRLLLSADLREATQKRLQMFVLRAKVTLGSQSGNPVALGLSGPQAEAALAAAGLPCPAEPMSKATDASMTVIRTEAARFIIIAARENAEKFWPALTGIARPAGLPAWRWLDVQAAYPLVTLATREEFVPQMADFDKIGGVVFNKGCYPGQEIVARTQYLGKVKRHLFRVAGTQPLPAGSVLYSPDNPDQSVGMIMSSAPAPAGGHAALAVVQSNFAHALRLDSLTGPALEAVAVNP